MLARIVVAKRSLLNRAFLARESYRFAMFDLFTLIFRGSVVAEEFRQAYHEVVGANPRLACSRTTVNVWLR